MKVDLDRPAPFDITDEREKNAIFRSIKDDGIFLVFHPSGGVWQVEGSGTIKIDGCNIRLLKNCRSDIEELMDKFDIGDDPPRPITVNDPN